MRKKRTRKKKLSFKNLKIKSLLLDNSLIISLGMTIAFIWVCICYTIMGVFFFEGY